MSQELSSWIYLLHGKGGSPNGTVELLEHSMLNLLIERHVIVRPSLPHGASQQSAVESVGYLDGMSIPFGATLAGISLGGLVAAKLQEDGRPDLCVIAVSSPTWAEGVYLDKRMDGRIAIYSSRDPVLEGRTANWPTLADADDVPWLTHDTDTHMDRLAPLLAACVNGQGLKHFLHRD